MNECEHEYKATVVQFAYSGTCLIETCCIHCGHFVGTPKNIDSYLSAIERCEAINRGIMYEAYEEERYRLFQEEYTLRDIKVDLLLILLYICSFIVSILGIILGAIDIMLYDDMGGLTGILFGIIAFFMSIYRLKSILGEIEGAPECNGPLLKTSEAITPDELYEGILLKKKGYLHRWFACLSKGSRPFCRHFDRIACSLKYIFNGSVFECLIGQKIDRVDPR